MDVNKIHGVEKVVGPSKAKPVERPSEAAPADEVTLSAEARERAEFRRVVDIVREAPEVRPERVEEVRALLRSGHYDSPEVIEKVAERLLGDLG